MTENSNGQIVVVTGGASGIGLGIARLFHATGAQVMIGDFNRQALDTLAATFAGHERIGFAWVDVRDPESTHNLVAEAEKLFGPITVMIANAGIVPNAAVLDMDVTGWDLAIETNLRGVFLSSQAAARSMIKNGTRGRIITISSIASHVGRPGAAAYCASKAGVEMFTKVLAMELAPHQINVNSVAPGVIKVRDNPAWETSEFGSAIMQALPRGHRGSTEDVAQAVLFLCSEQAEYISGAVLPVDGALDTGWTHMPFS